MITAVEITAPNQEDWDGSYWDPWESLGLRCCSYNAVIDIAAIRVLESVQAGQFGTDIAGIDPVLVELLKSIFCSHNWCEYGTSPRGCFPMDREGFHLLIDGWKAYYGRKWQEDYVHEA